MLQEIRHLVNNNNIHNKNLASEEFDWIIEQGFR